MTEAMPAACDADDGTAQDAAVIPSGAESARDVYGDGAVGGPDRAYVVIVGRQVDVERAPYDDDAARSETPPARRPPEKQQDLPDVPGVGAVLAALRNLDLPVFLEEIPDDPVAIPRRHDQREK
jgi:hypothetical protein